MPIKMRYHPPTGALAVYDMNGVDDEQPMYTPWDYNSRMKFHSALRYPNLLTQFDAVAALPLQTNGTDQKGTYQRDVITLGAHGQAQPPIIKAMLVNYLGANRPLQGSFPIQQAGNFCRVIDVGVNGGNVVLVYRGFTQLGLVSGVTGYNYPAINLTVRVWVFNWVIDGAPDGYNAALPQLQFTPSKIQVGRGRFDTDRDYIRSATGSENTLLTSGTTFNTNGSNPVTNSNPSWGWRYSVDGYAMQGQASGTQTAPFTRIQLP